MSRFRFIVAEKARHPIVLLCRVLRVSTSGFYAWQHRAPSARSLANAELLKQIKEVHTRSRGTYGSPRVHAELRGIGRRASRKRIARLMRAAELVGRGPRRFRRTTVADRRQQLPDLVQRHFNPGAPDRLWVGDITYIRTWEGWLYLAVILDAFSRRVVGWAVADHLRTELATGALRMALRQRRPGTGLVQHTDRGTQYTSSAYGLTLATHHVAQSVGRPGTAYDNAVAESFFATLKLELIYRHTWPTRRQVTSAIFEFIEGWYNRQRRHSTLGYLSPDAFEAHHRSVTLAA